VRRYTDRLNNDGIVYDKEIEPKKPDPSLGNVFAKRVAGPSRPEYIYIYIYMCVCVCVCMYVGGGGHKTWGYSDPLIYYAFLCRILVLLLPLIYLSVHFAISKVLFFMTTLGLYCCQH